MGLGLRGKTAIVAAASKGFGEGGADVAVRERAHVVLFSRDPEDIKAAADDVRALAAEGARGVGLSADVTRLADLERVVKVTLDDFRSINIVFNNAGGPKPGVFDTLDDDDWQLAFDLNLMSAIRPTPPCLPPMRALSWGRV